MTTEIEQNPAGCGEVRPLFVEYAESLSFDLGFRRGFDQELRNAPGRVRRHLQGAARFSSPGSRRRAGDRLRGPRAVSTDDAGELKQPLRVPAASRPRPRTPPHRSEQDLPRLASLATRASPPNDKRQPEMAAAHELYRYARALNEIEPYRENNPSAGTRYFKLKPGAAHGRRAPSRGSRTRRIEHQAREWFFAVSRNAHSQSEARQAFSPATSPRPSRCGRQSRCGRATPPPHPPRARARPRTRRSKAGCARRATRSRTANAASASTSTPLFPSRPAPRASRSSIAPEGPLRRVHPGRGKPVRESQPPGGRATEGLRRFQKLTGVHEIANSSVAVIEISNRLTCFKGYVTCNIVSRVMGDEEGDGHASGIPADDDQRT